MNLPYREVWAVDTEYRAEPGTRCFPVCAVFLELKSGREIRQWANVENPEPCPVDFGPDKLFVAYSAPAEFGYFLEMGWALPVRVLDLYVEFRALTNSTGKNETASLLSALGYFDLSAIDSDHKGEMRDMILNHTRYTPDQRRRILDYCAEDVYALGRLLPAMLPDIDLPRALFRGRYQCAVARMEATGIPMDMEMLGRVREKWDAIKENLIAEIDNDFGVYDGTTFKMDRFKGWLTANDIGWPTIESGALDMCEETFREMSKSEPRVAPLYELRVSLSKLKLNALTVGPDGRNRTGLMPFRSKTGRNQPSNTKSIFGPSTWVRGLIKPVRGTAIAYVDWSSQELGIAASLSRDRNMIDAYNGGDFYLAFAKMAGAVPQTATKKTHPKERDAYKTVALGVLFGLTEHGLAAKVGVSIAEARKLMRKHKEIFPDFWRWSDRVLMEGSITGKLRTLLGWPIKTEEGFRANTLKNFPVQGTGADMMRLACCEATEAGLKICCPVHDALVIEAPEELIEDHVAKLRSIMAEASRVLLDTVTLRTDATIIRYPDRYMDPRGQIMWDRVLKLL